MTIFKIEKNGREFTFVNMSRNTRNGFAHDCTMLVDSREYQRATCFYLNRTWEKYTYQSVALEAVNQEIDNYRRVLLDQFKEQHNYKRMTEARRVEFDAMFDSLDYIRTLRAVKQELKDHCFS